MTSNVVVVRKLSEVTTGSREGNWEAVSEICCQTGNNGRPIAADRWQFFGRFWVTPYRKIVPEWTYVAETNGKVVGYLTGCPNTRGFARTRFWRCTLPFLADIARGRYARTNDVQRFVRRIFHLERTPERCFPRQVKRFIAMEYPAHLHINVVAGHRRTGVGRQLVQRYLSDLREEGVRGVHLFCGEDSVEFYFKLGFREIGHIAYNNRTVHVLGCHC